MARSSWSATENPLTGQSRGRIWPVIRHRRVQTMRRVVIGLAAVLFLCSACAQGDPRALGASHSVMGESQMLIVLYLVVAAVCGVIGSFIGETRGRKAAGFWVGFLLGPIGCLA